MTDEKNVVGALLRAPSAINIPGLHGFSSTQEGALSFWSRFPTTPHVDDDQDAFRDGDGHGAAGAQFDAPHGQVGESGQDQ